MSPEAQRIAIAGTLGWTHIRPVADRNPDNDRYSYLAGSKRNFPHDECEVPNYPGDHNAMAVARKSLTKAERLAYIEALVDLTGAEWTDSYEEVFTVVDATPAQHAEAFLRAKGLWVEGATP